jgi:hypothetical protein
MEQDNKENKSNAKLFAVIMVRIFWVCEKKKISSESSESLESKIHLFPYFATQKRSSSSAKSQDDEKITSKNQINPSKTNQTTGMCVLWRRNHGGATNKPILTPHQYHHSHPFRLVHPNNSITL